MSTSNGKILLHELRIKGWGRGSRLKWLGYPELDETTGGAYYPADLVERVESVPLVQEILAENLRRLELSPLKSLPAPEMIRSDEWQNTGDPDDWSLVERRELMDRGWSARMIKLYIGSIAAIKIGSGGDRKDKLLYFHRQVGWLETSPEICDRLQDVLDRRPNEAQKVWKPSQADLEERYLQKQENVQKAQDAQIKRAERARRTGENARRRIQERSRTRHGLVTMMGSKPERGGPLFNP